MEIQLLRHYTPETKHISQWLMDRSAKVRAMLPKHTPDPARPRTISCAASSNTPTCINMQTSSISDAASSPEEDPREVGVIVNANEFSDILADWVILRTATDPLATGLRKPTGRQFNRPRSSNRGSQSGRNRLFEILRDLRYSWSHRRNHGCVVSPYDLPRLSCHPERRRQK